jgi:hypothetical protein
MREREREREPGAGLCDNLGEDSKLEFEAGS